METKIPEKVLEMHRGTSFEVVFFFKYLERIGHFCSILILCLVILSSPGHLLQPFCLNRDWLQVVIIKIYIEVYKFY